MVATALGASSISPDATAAAPTHDALVGLLIDSDREALLAQLVEQIRSGLDYPTFLGALAQAAARRIRPFPHVGFKYHAFMGLHAVHLTSVQGRPEDRWLPHLWAADQFKEAQIAEQGLGSWALSPVPEASVPAPSKLGPAFRRAMEQWDRQAADAAVVGLLRSWSLPRLFEQLFRYGARDFRAIGHKAITVTNCHRLLATIAPEHAEPMLRSLVLALLNHTGEPNPSAGDLAPDRPWRRNVLLSRQIGSGDRPREKRKRVRVVEMLEILREGSQEEASRAVLAELGRGAPETDLWSALFMAAGDLMLAQPGIISVHANTTLNALHYAYRRVRDPETGHLLLLQGASFLPLFRDLLGRDRRGPRIEDLAPSAPDPGRDARGVLDDIFATISDDRVEAARKTLGYLNAGGAATPFVRRAREYVVDRNVGYHDYKFAEAAFENAATMAPPWRARYLASSVLYLNGSSDKPNETVRQARALLG